MSTKYTDFIQDFPAFPLGKYELTVKHTVEGTGGNGVPSKTYQKTRNFEVKTSRYQLQSDAILQTFPVNNEQSAPAGMIPHVVLTVTHHSVFFYLQLSGYDVNIYFINYTNVDFMVMAFHLGLATLMAVVGAFLAYDLEKKICGECVEYL